MATVQVLNVSPSVDEAVLRNFFSFCGGIKSIEFNSHDLGPGELASAAKAAGAQPPASDAEAALVTFDSEDAAATAQLLSNSLLDDRPVLIVPAGSVKGKGDGAMAAGAEGEAAGPEAVEEATPKASGLLQAVRERAKSAQDQVLGSSSIQLKVSEAGQSAKDTASKLMSGETLRAGYGMFMSGLTSIKEAVKRAEEANRRFNERLLKEAHSESDARRAGQVLAPKAESSLHAAPAVGQEDVPPTSGGAGQEEGEDGARVEDAKGLPREAEKSR